jgi:hypothetical protein
MSPGRLSYIEAAHIVISMGIVTWYACFHSDVFQTQAYRIGVFIFGLSLHWSVQGFVQYLWSISVLWVVVTMNSTYYNLQWRLWNNYVHLHLRNLPPKRTNCTEDKIWNKINIKTWWKMLPRKVILRGLIHFLKSWYLPATNHDTKTEKKAKYLEWFQINQRTRWNNFSGLLLEVSRI